jgi:hypothetical protein
MTRRERITVVTASIAVFLSACIAGTDPDAVRALEKKARLNAAEAEARVKAMGLTPVTVAPNGQGSATMLETEGSGPGPNGWMSYVADAKAGPQTLQASAEAYIIGGYPPATITIEVSGAFDNRNGSMPFNTAVRNVGATRFFKAWASSCFERVRSSANIDALFTGTYGNTRWGPVTDDANKSCWAEDNCDQGMTRKSGRANLNSGMCDDDAPIYGFGAGDTPVDNASGSLHCWWYRDMLILFDPITGKMTDAFWIGDWHHECEYALLSSGADSRPSASIPVVLRARGPLGTTERPTMLVAEAGDTVSIAIDTTRATAADVDAALARAGSMWKLKSAGRADGIVATTMASSPSARKVDPGSRGAELLRAVKREASHRVRDRGRARELTTSVPRLP